MHRPRFWCIKKPMSPFPPSRGSSALATPLRLGRCFFVSRPNLSPLSHITVHLLQPDTDYFRCKRYGPPPPLSPTLAVFSHHSKASSSSKAGADSCSEHPDSSQENPLPVEVLLLDRLFLSSPSGPAIPPPLFLDTFARLSYSAGRCVTTLFCEEIIDDPKHDRVW